jgi:hypothetical protein
MANGTIAFDTLSTSGQISGTAKSVDTDYVVNGSGKASCLFDQTAPAIDASFNTASLTDTSAGKGIVNWTNNMSGALTYSCTTGVTNGNNSHPYLNAVLADKLHVSQTTSAFPFRAGYAGFENGGSSNPAGAFADIDGILVVAIGDLA